MASSSVFCCLMLCSLQMTLLISTSVELSTITPSGLMTVAVTGDMKVKVLHEGRWSFICGNQWDNNDARVVCRMLGYWHGQGTAELRRLQDGDPVMTDNVDCQGNETSLDECHYNGFEPQQCQLNALAAVNCDAIWPVRARLSEGYGPWEGRLELLDRQGAWRPVCQAGFDQHDAQVACRTLGIRRNGGQAHTDQKFPQSAEPPIVQKLNCQGTESELAECKGQLASKDENCTNAGVECYNCGAQYVEESGQIRSEGFPAGYPRSLDCLYLIRPTNDRLLYRLQFHNFSTEDCCDTLSVHVLNGSSTMPEGLSSSSTVPGGLLYSGLSLPPAVLGHAFALHFLTDGSRSDSGFSLTWRPARVEDFVSVTCGEGHFAVDVDFSSLQRLYPDTEASAIGLRDPGCVGTLRNDNGTGGQRLLITSPTDRCGTHIATSGGTISYSNVLTERVFADSSRMIVRARRWQMAVHCNVSTNHTLQVHYNPVPNVKKREITLQQVNSLPEVEQSWSSAQTDVAQARGRREVKGHIRRELDFPITMTAYKGPSYTSLDDLGANLYLHLGDPLYLRVALTGGDLDLKLVLQHCFTRPDHQVNLTYYVIRHGCEVDATTRITDIHTDHTDFTFTAFKFAGDFPQVFLTCDVRVCPTNENSTECSQRCLHVVSRRQETVTLGHVTTSRRLSFGPIILH